MSRRDDVERRGAQALEIGLAGLLHNYLQHHRRCARDSLQRLYRAPGSSLLTLLVIGVALALPALLVCGLNNLQQLAGGWEGRPQLTLFYHSALSDSKAREFTDQLARQPEIAEVRFMSRAEALAEFQALSGLGNALEALEDNPLPAVAVVVPAAIEREAIEALYQQLRGDVRVEQVLLDLAWVERLQAMTALGREFGVVVTGLFALGVLLVVGNTIRLAVTTRRDEIRVIKLVGGTNAYVRLPFLYTGLWYGLGGALVATLMVVAVLLVLQEPVAQLAALYDSRFVLLALTAEQWLLLLGGGALLGVLGARLSVARHLRTI